MIDLHDTKFWVRLNSPISFCPNYESLPGWQKIRFIFLTMSCIPIIPYFKVLLKNIHVIKQNQFIVPMDV